MFFINHIFKLLNRKGKKTKYIKILNAAVSAEDKPIKETQVLVLNAFFANRQKLFTDYSSLPVKK